MGINDASNGGLFDAEDAAPVDFRRGPSHIPDCPAGSVKAWLTRRSVVAEADPQAKEPLRNVLLSVCDSPSGYEEEYVLLPFATGLPQMPRGNASTLERRSKVCVCESDDITIHRD